MKALVRFIIFGAVLFPVFSIVISCSEEADCSMTTRAMMQCYLYTLDPDTKVVSNDTLDSLTVTAFGTDSVIINNQKKSARSLVATEIYRRLHRTRVSLQQDIDRYACYSTNQHTLLLVNGLRLSNETSHNRCPIQSPQS